MQVKEQLVQVESDYVQAAAPNIAIEPRVVHIEAVSQHLHSTKNKAAPVSAALFFISMCAGSYNSLQESH